MAVVDLGDLESARELLKHLQAEQTHDCWYPTIPADDAFYESNARRIGGWIQQIDELRPLDSKTGEHIVHTPYCGCEDVMHVATWYSMAQGENFAAKSAYTCKCYMRCDHSVNES